MKIQLVISLIFVFAAKSFSGKILTQKIHCKLKILLIIIAQNSIQITSFKKYSTNFHCFGKNIK